MRLKMEGQDTARRNPTEEDNEGSRLVEIMPDDH